MVMLAGCVTTSDSRFSKEADKEKAVRNYVQLATAYIAQGNLERARNHLERALEIDAESASGLAAMALIYQREGDSELAEQSFKKAIQSDGGYTRGRVYYGAFLFGQKKFEAARDQFAQAASNTAYEDRGSVFFNLGRTYEQLDNPQAATAAYQRAVELTRGDARSLLALSTLLVDAGNYSEASRYYSRLTGMLQRSAQMQHTPESLLTGIRLARHFNERDQEASFALLLRNEHPKSDQYQQYKALISNDE
nr:type IV pilus biogenesis/stability protein PilW [Marinobacter caseinilyticus]